MPKDRFKNQLGFRLTTIAWFILFCLFLMSIPTVKAWTPLLLAFIAGLALLLAALVYTGYCWISKNHWHLKTYALAAIFFLFLLTSVAGLPIYYLSYIATATPIAVPQVTLSNGSKTVIFQGMMHVGSEGFYKSVVYDLENALNQGFHLYYEGIKPGSPEANKWFNDLLAGGKDLSGNYRNLATLCGLTFQLDYFFLLLPDQKLHPERHLVADIDIDTMKKEFDRLMSEDRSFASEMNKRERTHRNDDSTETIEGFVKWQQSGTAQQKLVSGIVCRGIMTRVLKQSETNEDPMNRVILDFRNQQLADRIQNDKNAKIYITYGSRHIKGVIALLQKHDPNWSVKSIKWSRVIIPPDDLKGEL